MTAVGICILLALQKRFRIKVHTAPVEKLVTIWGGFGCHLIFKYFYTGGRYQYAVLCVQIRILMRSLSFTVPDPHDGL